MFTMFDYSLVAAVAAVVREGSFERAALALHITPSAVSQRVKLLEQRAGQVLVVRGQPCTATPAGRLLCTHAEQVAMLEHDLAHGLPRLGAGDRQGDGDDAAGGAMLPRATLRIVVNADSLATWFVSAAARFSAQDSALLDLRLEDEQHTAEQLRQGEVLAAVTALAAPVQGCSSLPLGAMRYLATASPAFVARHFAQGVSAAALARAPCLTFSQKDRLQDRWLQAQAGMPLAPPRHWLPASQAFVDASLAGLGWGMNPAALVAAALADGRLVELVPGSGLTVDLHWQHPRAAAPLLQRLTRAVQGAAREHLQALIPEPSA